MGAVPESLWDVLVGSDRIAVVAEVAEPGESEQRSETGDAADMAAAVGPIAAVEDAAVGEEEQ